MTSLSDAQYLWIDSDVRSAASRRWLELPATVAAFFATLPTGKSKPQDRTILIKPRRANPVSCLLSFRPDDAANADAPWRLDLPTATQGAPQYANMVVRFYRTTAADAETVIFELDAEPTASDTAQRWHRITLARGHASNDTPQPRSFGYW